MVSCTRTAIPSHCRGGGPLRKTLDPGGFLRALGDFPGGLAGDSVEALSLLV